MRFSGPALLILLAAAPCRADPIESFSLGDFAAGEQVDQNYALGGAARRIEPAPAPSGGEAPVLRLSSPDLIRQTGASRKDTPFGALGVFFGESWNGRDLFHVGTSLTRGQTTAGVSVTYERDGATPSSSQVFVDYALSEQFSVGLSGVLSEGVTLGDEPVPQLGLNAEYTGSNGSFLQGGVAGTSSDNPIFGLAMGLRF